MKKILSINPASLKIQGEITASSQTEISEKVKLARSVFSEWKALGVKNRIKILQPLMTAFKKSSMKLLSSPPTRLENQFQKVSLILKATSSI